MATYRLRVELPDQPGALADVAAVIASSAGNVLAIDIHELESASAVDEILIEAADDWDGAALGAALPGVGAELLSWAPAVDRIDTMVRALRFAGALVASEPSRSSLELGRALLELTGATAAWVSPKSEAMRYEAGRRAIAHDGPVVMRTDDLPASVSEDVNRPVWLLAVPDGGMEAKVVAFAVRPLALRFTTSEIARVEALLALHSVLADRAALAR
jgi:hypothetical protein